MPSLLHTTFFLSVKISNKYILHIKQEVHNDFVQISTFIRLKWCNGAIIL